MNLPRWRGFNLQGCYTIRQQSGTGYNEDYFRWISGWGFDFVRLPTDYRFWSSNEDPFFIDQQKLEELDRTVRLGQKYGLHVSLNLHRAPGYCVNDRLHEEPFSLWKDRLALEAFCLHWEVFSRRYKGISSKQLSFDLVNEPPGVHPDIMTRADHRRVIKTAAETIKKIDPFRLIIADGVRWGAAASPDIADLGVAQSCRAYAPQTISHHQAPWVKAFKYWPIPKWPGVSLWGERWDRARLEEFYRPWIDLKNKGVGVHCGEGGFYCKTPHAAGMAWLRDVLEILTENSIGYALWNFRGSFGILDSGRTDVKYEDWHGHKLDRKLLNLLQKF